MKGGIAMNKEDLEILEELSKQNYFGDLPFSYYADLIGRLLANYNKEKERNKELEKKLKIAKQLCNDACVCIATECVEKDKIKEEIRELEQQIAEFKEYVKDSKGQEKIYWRRELAELVGARNSLRGLLKEV